MSLRISQIFSISELAAGAKLNRVNDAVAGGSQPTGFAVPGGGVVNAGNLRRGQLGFEVEMTTAEALLLSDTVNVGTLFAGVYQYVQLAAGGAQPARGNVAFLASFPTVGAPYVVSADAATAATLLRPVGVFINAITLGNFGWIQTAGLMSLQFATTIGPTATDGNLVKAVNQAGVGVGQMIDTDLADTAGTTGISAVKLAPYIASGMYAAELPVNNTITRVWGRPLTRLL